MDNNQQHLQGLGGTFVFVVSDVIRRLPEGERVKSIKSFLCFELARQAFGQPLWTLHSAWSMSSFCRLKYKKILFCRSHRTIRRCCALSTVSECLSQTASVIMLTIGIRHSCCWRGGAYGRRLVPTHVDVLCVVFDVIW